MSNWFFVVLVTGLLAACGSSVKLETVPVEDKVGIPVLPAGQVGFAGGGQMVTSVDLGRPTQEASKQSAGNVVYFDYDSAVIRPEFQSIIENHGRAITASRSKKVAIEGHTDERGGREYNLALGQKRAEAVRKALALLGVEENQMEAVSFGKEKPAVVGSTEAIMEKNRRAEIVYR